MRLVFIILVFFTFQLQGQSSLQEGFNLLDQQSYEEASDFFSKILETDTENKTAKICLARAKGLGGNTSTALNLLDELKEKYPDDLEVGLNLAEAYLWAKNPQPAADIYTEILKINPENFTAIFGKANALSSLFKYEQALPLINKALKLQPRNNNAITSKRYIQYGVADQKRKNQDYKGAIRILDTVLITHKNDQQALINKGICYLSMQDINNAEWVFNFMQKRNINDFESSLLLSHINLIKHKNESAIFYANKALKNTNAQDENNFIRANIQKVNVLGASKRFDDANEILDMLSLDYPKHNDILLARARMLVWDQDYNLGLEKYALVPDSNYVFHMGLAEAYKAQRQNLKAKCEIEKSLLLIPNQPDALGLLREVKLAQSPKLHLMAATSSDIGKNEANDYLASLALPIKEKHTLLADVGYRKTFQGITLFNATQKSIFLGDHVRFNHKFDLMAKAGLIQYDDQEQTSSQNILFDLKSNYQLTKNHRIGFGYLRDALKYSSDLIRSGILKESFVGTYVFSKNNWPSLYLQYDKTKQSDDNSRNVFFSSLFYQVSTFPLIKSGINFTQMSYDESRPELYFSPELYQVIEAFIHFGNDFETRSKFMYHFEATFGKQKLDQDPRINTTRISAELGYKFTDRLNMMGQYFYSTAANSTNKGFSFTQYKLKMNLIL